MADPTIYSPSYDFTAFQVSNPTTPLPADKVEIELNAIEATTGEIITNLTMIQRSDGALKNGIVGLDALDPAVLMTVGIGDISEDIETVAAITGDISIVAGISTDVSAVAAISADVTIVAENIATLSEDIDSVLEIASDVAAVANVAGSIPAVAAVSLDIPIVADIADDISAVAAIADDVANAEENAAIAANAAASLKGTSTTTALIQEATIVFTTQSSRQFQVGQFVQIVSDTAPLVDWMFGQVTAYSGTLLTVEVTMISGGGTHSDWSIYVSAAAGPAGANGRTLTKDSVQTFIDISAGSGEMSVIVPFNCTVESITVVADVTGEVTLDISSTTLEDYPNDFDLVTDASITFDDLKYQEIIFDGTITELAKDAILKFEASSVENAAKLFVSVNIIRYSDIVPLEDGEAIVLLGDSLFDVYFDAGTNQAALAAAAATYFPNAQFYDFAHGGWKLVSSDGTNAFWDKTDDQVSTWYEGVQSTYSSIEPRVAVISLLTNDVGGSEDSADLVSYYEGLITQLCSDYSSIEHIIVRILGRHITNNNYDFDKFRDVQWQVVMNNTSGKIKGVSEIYHLPINDGGNVHPNTEGFAQAADELCAQIHSLLAFGTMAGLRGPIIADVQVSGTTPNKINLTLDTDGAETVIIPSGAADMFRIGITENAVQKLITPISCLKTSNTQIELQLPSRLQGTAPELWYGYQTIYGLDDLNPPVIKSNQVPLLLPLRLSRDDFSLPASDDEVKKITGLEWDCNPQEQDYVFKADTLTNQIDSIGSINGRRWNNVNADMNPVIVDNAANGRRGLKSVAGSHLRPDANTQTGAVRGVIIAGQAPGTTGGGSILTSFGINSTPNLQAGFQMSNSGSGTLLWSRNGSNAFHTIKTGFWNEDFILAAIFDVSNNVTIYYNDPTTPVINGLPALSTYETCNNLQLFGSSTSNGVPDFTILRAASWNGALSGTTVADLFTQFNTDYGFGLSW